MVEVKLKLRDLVARYGSIAKLREAPKIRAKLAFALSVLSGQVTSAVRQFEEVRSQRMKLLGEKNGAGEIELKGASKEQFIDEVEELLDQEVTIKAEPVELPANFEMDGLVAVVSDWAEFLTMKE